MNRMAAVLAIAVLIFTAGCHTNDSPGNEREAQLDPPPTPASRATAREIMATQALDELQPETMSDADLASIGVGLRGCKFLLTRVALPSFAYGGPYGFVKLNEKLVPLPRQATGKFEEGGLQISIITTGKSGKTEPQPAQMILRMARQPDERGYSGYLDCRDDR